MDDSNAYLIDLTSTPVDINIITSKFKRQAKEDMQKKREKGMHNKKQHQQATYYKKWSDAIKSYRSVLLFGPINAKTALFNILNANHLLLL